MRQIAARYNTEFVGPPLAPRDTAFALRAASPPHGCAGTLV